MIDRTLVVQTAFLGDVVLTTPLLQVLAERVGPVDVVTTPAAAALLDTHPAVREVIRYDKHGADHGMAAFLRLARRLRERKYAIAYLPHRSWRTAALALVARVPERIGFADSPAAITYTRRVSRPLAGHEVERLLALADAATVAPPVTLGLTDADRRAAVSWLAVHDLNDGFVALAPGSIWGTKRWPRYAELAREIDLPVVVVGGPDDRALADAIVAQNPGRSVSAVGELSLRQSAALIERARALVTNDSAPLHLATAVGTPIVAIFGPTVPAFGFGPRGPHDVIIEHPAMPCRPCSAHGPAECPLGHHRCMTEIPADRVTAAVAALLAGTSPTRPERR